MLFVLYTIYPSNNNITYILRRLLKEKTHIYFVLWRRNALVSLTPKGWEDNLFIFQILKSHFYIVFSFFFTSFHSNKIPYRIFIKYYFWVLNNQWLKENWIKIKNLNGEYFQYLMKSIYHFNFSLHFLRYNAHLENFNTNRNMHEF